MSDANTILMQSILESWGAAIDNSTHGTTIVPAFVAGLIANESGGKADAPRFEPAVFERLKEVLLGTRPHYSPAGIKKPLTAADLSAYCDPGSGDDRGNFSDALQQLHNLSTSWGLTQIMGWHLVEFESGMSTGWLATPGGNLNFTQRLAAWFAERYQLDLSTDFPPLFTCWNTGEPDGKTFDPNYVANGLARMQIYQALLDARGRSSETVPG